MYRNCLIVITLSIVIFSFSLVPLFAQDVPTKPFILPIAEPAGPSTWLFGQPYGNTVGAYNFGTAWYSAGQGLHFGIDVSMPCGTPLVAVADGSVIYLDNLAFGAGPHNLILRHDAIGVTTLYGHLLNMPPLQQYQSVTKGQLVGYSGDPDVTCDSRPHLHFEVRSLDYRTAYNPINYIEAPWDTLAAVGRFDSALFQMDLTNPRQWMRLDDQPPVAFGGARLNAYAQSWPPPNNERPQSNTAPLRPFTPLADAEWSMRPLSYEGCCSFPFWHPSDPNRLFAVDGSPGYLAGIFEWNAATGDLVGLTGDAPPPRLSPDGTLQIINAGGQISIRRLSDNAEWVVQTGGFVPTVSPDNARLLWQVQNGISVPGATPPNVEIWVSDLDGANPRMVISQPRVSAHWLNGEQLLISATERTVTTLSVYNVINNASYTLGSWDRLRGLSIAPGGQRVLFYQSFQEDTTVNGVYALEMQPNAVPVKLSWFGGWRWRDSESLYYIPFDPTSSAQSLAYYHIPTGENRQLTDPMVMPFSITNGDWSVSADGSQIVFQNPSDRRLWILEASA